MPQAHFIKEEHLMECVKKKFLQLVVKNLHHNYNDATMWQKV